MARTRAAALVLASFAMLACSVGCGDSAPPSGDSSALAAHAERLSNLAQCLTERGWVLYSSAECPACRAQRKAFGGAFARIEEIECHPQAPDTQHAICRERGILKTPTWVQVRAGAESQRLEGYQPLEALASAAGCEL
jgi:hypothetical protein